MEIIPETQAELDEAEAIKLEAETAESMAKALQEAKELIAQAEAEAAARAIADDQKDNWDYQLNGADWPELFPDDCAQTNQSPIDLPTEGLPKYKASIDKFNKMYTNQVEDIPVEFYHYTTTQVSVNKEGQDLQMFESLWSPLVMGGTDRFKGVQFHFHSGSEHTVDGVRHDLEMHTVHLASESLNDINYAAMGIIFSVNEFTANLNPIEIKIIDDFFDSMDWESTEDTPLVPEVPYGNLMMMVDMTRRWVYKGSVTTPPCGRFVYWNVVKTIYPIKQRHVD